jgi:5'-nucleotidase
MNILICNDDGIFSEGILTLATILKSKHNLTVYAPTGNRSGFSRSMSFHKDVEIKKVNAIDGVDCYSVSGTPADCVKFAVTMHKTKFDLVVSGINSGPNLGSDIFYSGTVNACFEASIEGIPSIAFSNVALKDFKFSETGKIIDKIFNNLVLMADKNHVLNVNIPNVNCDEIQGVKLCSVGNRKYTDGYIKTQENVYKLIGEPIQSTESDFGTDVYYSDKNYVTITPLSHNITDFNVLKTLKDIDF